MKIPLPGDDGSQPRSYVISRLIDFGIGVHLLEENTYELTDADEDVEVVILKDPVNHRIICHLWRRFGHAAGMLITDFVAPKTCH
ncbi:hypothetical protein [Stenotrophomonas rhizophila]|uniref:hypothetical protein n=1 Tax=Stenotrophomonas rhizophila TaxID=216778 RepID=UPI0028A65187|nr:hypothetical protein [Stenotrophomonas rhizophila]